MARIVNAIKIIQRTTNLPISVDTCRAAVAKEALELGVDIINDVTGLKYDAMMPKIIERYSPSLILCAYSKKSLLVTNYRKQNNC
uniref:Dihydropteroate synthase (FolP) n=1 Tax=uncultured marine thaumarchaeote AD1000_31_F12 TaxID=1455906 RepID=A0A075FP07_9ARCH|nr:dihydropteroate synthase (folP) [uncultured marine thaumarchaeote AD1000_31_F12]